ncbi:MAG: hypothetical protein ABJP02_08460 [Parasphingorhabdus sp.]|uniref:hypothetical protein n=1 Tax=Parasphingorhabdus sp. TaxID=2709688 RepID=UPI0032991B41
MKTAMKTLKVAIVIAVSATTPPAFASVQLNPSVNQKEDTTPSGLIIVKMLQSEEQLEMPQPDAKAKPAQKITDKRSPDYVRCRIEPVASSILKTRRVCMTNREWKLAIRLGNKYATEFVADNQPGFFAQ